MFMSGDIGLITIDISEFTEELKDLLEFIKKKLAVDVKVEDKNMMLDSGEEHLSRGTVKDYLARFLHRRGLESQYRVRSEKDTIKIVKKKS